MPLRSSPSPLARRLQRLFHSSAVRRASEQNHYETLQVPTTATPAEVKKSFYALSKLHHPDHNPSDPSASSRFLTISEAYATLSTPAKRQAYDRSLNLHSPSTQSSTYRPHGSYSSSGPAGGRPASGLSRRRTQFRGPPPSFYRSGGWGEHEAKRSAAQGGGMPRSHEKDGFAAGEGHGGSKDGSADPGMGPGQKGWRHDDLNDVPHWDREGHFRTQERHSRRWQRRRGNEDRNFDGDVPRSMLANFFFVGGIISLGIFVPTLIFEKLTRREKGVKEK